MSGQLFDASRGALNFLSFIHFKDLCLKNVVLIIQYDETNHWETKEFHQILNIEVYERIKQRICAQSDKGNNIDRFLDWYALLSHFCISNKFPEIKLEQLLTHSYPGVREFMKRALEDTLVVSQTPKKITYYKPLLTINDSSFRQGNRVCFRIMQIQPSPTDEEILRAAKRVMQKVMRKNDKPKLKGLNHDPRVKVGSKWGDLLVEARFFYETLYLGGFIRKKGSRVKVFSKRHIKELALELNTKQRLQLKFIREDVKNGT